MGAGELVILLLLLAGCAALVVWVRGVVTRGRARIRREEEAAGIKAVIAPRPASVPRQELIPGADRPALERWVVERQVLVMRRRHCATITPVDLSACSHCGAKL